jgi:acetylglutamate kinase
VAFKTNHRHTTEQKTKAVKMMADQTNRVAFKTNHRHTTEQKTEVVEMMADQTNRVAFETYHRTENKSRQDDGRSNKQGGIRNIPQNRKQKSSR